MSLKLSYRVSQKRMKENSLLKTIELLQIISLKLFQLSISKEKENIIAVKSLYGVHSHHKSKKGSLDEQHNSSNTATKHVYLNVTEASE
ncbi:CLUMA_CG010901, isoform A [Clunio marinus]|uniref:CLUMA_CG010901, isoform A n=1 Tax=Clunio marinus TaxID=568069 RepID=A0A1J1IBA2_9DIPT|nr:CLUMA_CG010901, isoform A [Clunio marinus]